jgi:hypothetical protein
VKLTRRFRFLAFLYAITHAYFWADCPICGRKFGGFETADRGLMDSWYSGELVCWRCGDKAKRRNQKYMKDNPAPSVIYDPSE